MYLSLKNSRQTFMGINNNVVVVAGCCLHYEDNRGRARHVRPSAGQAGGTTGHYFKY